MLVLSRRPNEQILFPTVGVSVKVLGVKGSAVRLGIQAPPEVTVLREELPDHQAEWAARDPAPDPAVRSLLVRLVGHRLRVADVGLGLLQEHLRAGQAAEALTLAERLGEDLRLLQRRLSAPAEQPRPVPPSLPRGCKALLVEDNANERALLARFLRQGGFDVDTAGDGADALDYLHAGGRPDVVLLDMGMPRCDGPTTVRAIRRDGSLAGLKVVAVSGHRPEEYDGLGPGPGGVDRWFCKPLDPDALLRDLEQVLGRPAAP